MSDDLAHFELVLFVCPDIFVLILLSSISTII